MLLGKRLTAGAASLCIPWSAGLSQPATMHDMATGNLPLMQERLAETFALDARLLLVHNNPNYPFDFSMTALYEISSISRGPGLCAVDTLELSIQPTRHLMSGGPTYEHALQEMFESHLTITGAGTGRLYARAENGDRRPTTDCASNADYQDMFRADSEQSAEKALTVTDELLRRRDEDYRNVEIVCNEGARCREVMATFQFPNVSSANRCLDGDASDCVRLTLQMYSLREAQSLHGLEFLEISGHTGATDIGEAPLRVEYGSYPPPPPV